MTTITRTVLASALLWAIAGCSDDLDHRPQAPGEPGLQEAALEKDKKDKKIKLWKLDDPCEPNPCTTTDQTVCAYAEGAVVCLCDEGYTFADNGVCVSEDDLFAVTPCDSNPCTDDYLFRSLCLIEAGQRVCVCAPGYVPSDTQRDCVDPCATADCNPNQACVVTWAGPVCEKLP